MQHPSRPSPSGSPGAAAHVASWRRVSRVVALVVLMLIAGWMLTTSRPPESRTPLSLSNFNSIRLRPEARVVKTEGELRTVSFPDRPLRTVGIEFDDLAPRHTKQPSRDTTRERRVLAVRLPYTQTQDADLNWLSTIPELQLLTLDGTFVTDGGLDRLLPLSNLTALSVEDTAITDAGLATVGRLGGLTFLDLRGTAITNRGMHHLERLQHLTALDLSETRVNGDGLAVLAGLTHLQALSVNGLSIEDRHLEPICRLQSLRGVNLARTRISDGGLTQLVTAPRLETICVVGSSVTAAGIAAFRRARPEVTVLFSKE